MIGPFVSVINARNQSNEHNRFLFSEERFSENVEEAIQNASLSGVFQTFVSTVGFKTDVVSETTHALKKIGYVVERCGLYLSIDWENPTT